MAKSVKDLSDVTQIVLQAAKEPRILDVQFQNNWSGITLGFVDPEKWRLPEELFTSDPEYLKHIVRLSLYRTTEFALRVILI